MITDRIGLHCEGLLINVDYFFLFLSACSGHLEEKNDRTIEGDFGGTCAKRSDKVNNVICLQMIQNVCNY